MLSRQVKHQIEDAFNEIQINLENNYKDLAIQARMDAEHLLQQLQESGKLTGRHYDKYKSILDGYTERMKGYHH